MNIKDAERHLFGIMGRFYYRGQASGIASRAMERITGMGVRERIVNATKALTPEQEKLFERFAEELKVKPHQYVLNERNYDSYTFYVDENVTIPKMEAGSMVNFINDLVLKNRADSASEGTGFSIIDVGTGSGFIAILLKKYSPSSTVYACDISEKALQVAMRNSRNIGADIKIMQLNFLDSKEWKKLPMFDLIVCNPPFVPDLEALSKKGYEPYDGLFIDNTDSLVFYKALAAFAQRNLKPKGQIFVQVRENLQKAFIKLFESYGFVWVHTYEQRLLEEDLIISAYYKEPPDMTEYDEASFYLDI